MTDDKLRGIYDKFRIERTDGKSRPGRKHDGCTYFVLDITHDPFAVPALLAYADSCEAEYPELAADCRRWVARPKGYSEGVMIGSIRDGWSKPEEPTDAGNA